jgi:hypothetical protein
MRVDEFFNHKLPAGEGIRLLVQTCKEQKIEDYNYDLLLAAADECENAYKNAADELLELANDLNRKSDELFQELALEARGLSVLLLVELCLRLNESNEIKRRIYAPSKN